jgi:hypothetical protein
MKNRLLIISFCLIQIAAYSRQTVDTMPKLVSSYFADVKKACDNQSRIPWNKQLYGPILLVDRSTRAAYANMPGKQGLLKHKGSIYTGKVSVNTNIANTATDWGGMKWTMVLLPLPSDKDRRNSLMIHELYHRIQDEIGLPAKSPNCSHLDTKDGRLYLRLELDALKAAVQKPVNERVDDLVSALLFRKYRQQLFAGSEELENQLEWNEGLAEFTGTYVSDISLHDKNYLASIVDNATKFYPTFTRSLGYITGPLYGMLLSQKHKDWQKTITSSDNFPGQIIKWYNLELSQDVKSEVTARASNYDYDQLSKEEQAREDERLATEKKYMTKLVDGPVLVFQLTDKMKFSFNPNNLFSLGKFGTVYPTMTMTDDWGRLVVTGEALMKDWKVLYVPTPSSSSASNLTQGDGWQLELKNGWQIVPGERTGDFKCVSVPHMPPQ